MFNEIITFTIFTIKNTNIKLIFLECGIEECSEGCKTGNSCDCNPKDTDVCKYI